MNNDLIHATVKFEVHTNLTSNVDQKLSACENS